MKARVILFTALFFVSLCGFSQEFEAKLIGGFSASQIHGDGYGGYNQLGGVFGFSTNFYLKEDVSFEQNILYYGRGSRASAEEWGFDKFNIKGLHYVDIVAVLNYHIQEKYIPHAGLGYGILGFIRTDDFDQTSNYRPDVFFTLGLSYKLSEKTLVTARWQRSTISANKFFSYINDSINFSLGIGLN